MFEKYIYVYMYLISRCPTFDVGIAIDDPWWIITFLNEWTGIHLLYKRQNPR